MSKKRRKSRSSLKRDYAAEYKRRVERGRKRGWSMAIIRGHTPKTQVSPSLGNKLKIPPGTEIEDIRIQTVPGIPGDDPRAIKRALRDEGFSAAELRRIDVTDQEEFVRTLVGNYGFTYREAFDLFFGY